MINKRSLLSDEDLIEGAQAIANDMRIGDTHRLKLARIIDPHLDWFAQARARGLEWTDIIDVLFRAGVKRPDGRPLSRGHLSSLVWRRQQSKITAPMQTPRPALVSAGGNPKTNRTHSAAPGAAIRAAGGPLTIETPDGAARAPDLSAKAQIKPNDAEGAPGERNRLVAYMQRSARVRGGK
ncbi:MAG: hypothetical protein ABS75_31925 [Pelagibacterium sp. SCN 63-23]|nr:MAG: hypothetical protein ABS75_31925 [Pelagibacterium sp. SCN 63-23]